MEAWEYSDSLSIEACDMDSGRLRFDSGEVVMIGGKGGWLGFEVGEEKAGGGEAAGEGVVDMTAVMFGGCRVLGRSRAMSQRQSRPSSKQCLDGAPYQYQYPRPKHRCNRSQLKGGRVGPLVPGG